VMVIVIDDVRIVRIVRIRVTGQVTPHGDPAFFSAVDQRD